MATRVVFSNLVMALVAMPILCLLMVITSASAQNNAGNYAFLVGSGLLCDIGDSSSCPAVVGSANGDSYEMSGAGTLDGGSGSLTAAGTFNHKSSDGYTLETGIWVATELVSFESYGVAPGALLQAGSAFGPLQSGSMRSRMFASSMPVGGLAVFHIRLFPMRGVSKTATLQVNCALGKVPEVHQRGGIRLTFEGGRAEFDQEISGRTMFVLTRPGAGSAAKPPTTEGEPNSQPTQAQP